MSEIILKEETAFDPTTNYATETIMKKKASRKKKERKKKKKKTVRR